MADPWLEGLQLDQLKIYEEGKLNDTLYRVIKDNIRFPESSLGDMKSQMAACRLAARRMDELFDKYGKDTILAAISQIFDETERKCRNVVAQLPDGVYEAEASIDDDGLLSDEEVPIRVKITIKGSDMTIDLSGCSAERKAAINSRTYAGARVAYKALTGPLDPVNEGSFRALKVIIPEGNIMMAQVSGADVGLERDRADRGGHDRARALPRRCRTAFRPVITGCSAARWCSSGCIPRPSGASSCRASKAAAGAAGRSRTASPLRSRCARATCATARSRASSSNVRWWSKAARCARIPAAPGSTAAGSDSTARCATWSRASGISSGPGAASVRPGGSPGGTPGEPGGNLLKQPGEKASSG